MNIRTLSKGQKFLLFFIVIWILDSFQAYFFLDENISKAILHGLIYSFFLNVVFHFVGLDSGVIYCKPEFENDIKSEIENLGYRFFKNKDDWQVYQKKGTWFNKKISIRKTPFNIQVSIPTWMDHPFGPYSQSKMKTT